MSSTVAIVWPCPIDVDAYAAAGRAVTVPRPDCPGCDRAMIFWFGYERDVRTGDVRRIWVRRAKCRPCGVSHALIPAFCLLGRLDAGAVVGAGLFWAISGAGMRTVAAALDVPHTTARDWRRRHRGRAAMLAAGFAAMTVSLGASAPRLSADPERASLEALAAAWEALRRRLGASTPSPWRLWSVVTGGAALLATRDPPWATRVGWVLMPPVPQRP